MASIGVRYPRYCPYVINYMDDGTETEVLGVGKVMGKAMRVTVTINAEAVTQYADDGPAEVVTEFNSGTIANENNDLIASVESDLLGKTNSNGEIISGGDDTPPYCRVGWIESKLLDNKRLYRGQVYLRVKYSPPGEDLQTKGQTITFGSVTLNGAIMLNADRNYERHKDFDTVNEAIAYLDKLLNMGGVIAPLTFTSNPLNNSVDIPVNSAVTITFSNVIDHGNAMLFNAESQQRVPSSIAFDSTKKILQVTPSGNLLTSEKYFLVLSGVTDAYNQTLQDTMISFTTAAGG